MPAGFRAGRLFEFMGRIISVIRFRTLPSPRNDNAVALVSVDPAPS